MESTFTGIDSLTTGFTAGTGALFSDKIYDIGTLAPSRSVASYAAPTAYVYETTTRGGSAYNTDGTYTFAAPGTSVGGTVVYDNTASSEKLTFYGATKLEMAYTTADQKAFAASLKAGDKITIASGAITAVEFTGSVTATRSMGALTYPVTVADVATGVVLTVDRSASAAMTITKTTGTGYVKLATAAPSGVTVNGDAALDINNIASTITDVASGKTLTLSSTGGTPALTVTKTTGTLKMATASVPLTVNGDATVDIANLATSIADVASAKTLTLTNSGDGSAGDVTITKAGTIAGTVATVAAAKTFAKVSIGASTVLTALTVGAGSTITVLENKLAGSVITTLTVNGSIGAVDLAAAGVITNAVVMGTGGNFKVAVAGDGLQTFANAAGNIVMTAAATITTAAHVTEVAGTAGTKFAVQVIGSAAKAEIVAKAVGIFGTTGDIAAAFTSTAAPVANVDVKILNTGAAFTAL